MKRVAELRFEERAKLTGTHGMAKQIFEIMVSKRSNLCVAADVSTVEEIICLAQRVGPYVCAIKVHVDTLDDFTLDRMYRLRGIARQHNFLIFEDRKFADIGTTVTRQLTHGVHRIARWADLVNAHIISGPDIVTAIAKVATHVRHLGHDDTSEPRDLGLLLIASMSSRENLFSPAYAEACKNIARQHREIVVGFIAQSPMNELADSNFIVFTPGVKFADPDAADEVESSNRTDTSTVCSGSDHLGQQYRTPHYVVMVEEADVIIVGRGIVEATNIEETAGRYRDEAWKAYLARVHDSTRVTCE